MFFCACYIIPAGSTAIENSGVFDNSMNDMTELYGEFRDDICILIGGDFNARTSDKHDYMLCMIMKIIYLYLVIIVLIML